MLIRDEQQQLSRLVIALVVIFLICHSTNAVYSLCQATGNFLSATFDDDSTAAAPTVDEESRRKLGKKFGSGELSEDALICITSLLFFFLVDVQRTCCVCICALKKV